MAEPLAAQIGRIAARQQGNVTRSQLLTLGLSRSAIARRRQNGYLYRVFSGVYHVGHPARTSREIATAAALSCGDAAVLTDLWAIALWDFSDWPTGEPHIIVPGRRAPAGVQVHRTIALPAHEIRRRDGIPVTSPARAILDAAPLLPTRRRNRIVNNALRTPLLYRSELARVRADHPRHPGAVLLGPYIDTDDGPSDSDWEDDFPGLCVSWGVPRPLMHRKVCGLTVDALFPDVMLIVELDGWKYHNERDDFETDRDRDGDTLAAGYGTLRITWRRITRQPGREFARLQRILEQRSGIGPA